MAMYNEDIYVFVSCGGNVAMAWGSVFLGFKIEHSGSRKWDILNHNEVMDGNYVMHVCIGYKRYLPTVKTWLQKVISPKADVRFSWSYWW